MKSRFLTIGIIVAITISAIYVSFAYNQEIKLGTGMMTGGETEPRHVLDPICFVIDSTTSREKGSAVTLDRCFQLSEFETMGCTNPMLEHLYEYSNVLAPEYNGVIYLDFIGLPEGMSHEKFNECFENLSEFRRSLHPEPSSEPEITSHDEKHLYPFGPRGPIISQETCSDLVTSQWQPTIEGREMVQQSLEICIGLKFMTPELVERGKVADNFTTGSIKSAQKSAQGDVEKTIEILEQMYVEKTSDNLEKMHGEEDHTSLTDLESSGIENED